jgi:hypothetical protein
VGSARVSRAVFGVSPKTFVSTIFQKPRENGVRIQIAVRVAKRKNRTIDLYV